LSEPSTENYYIHQIRLGCIDVNRVLTEQVTKSPALSLRPLFCVLINLLSLLNSVAPLS
jgi:hypothetical protein